MDIDLKLIYIRILRDNWKPLKYKEDETGGFVMLGSPNRNLVFRYYLYRNYPIELGRLTLLSAGR